VTNEATDESTINSSSKKVVKDENLLVLKRLAWELSADTAQIFD
jgi:hypothetical protein